MFGHKPEQNIPAPDFPIETIPADFYAGANPIVKFRNVEKTVDMHGGITRAEKKLLDKKTAAGASARMHPANLFTNRKFLIIAGVVFFVLFIAGASWYYWNQAKQAQLAAYVPPAPVITPPVAEPAPEPVVEPPTTTVETPPVPTVVAPAPIEFPSALLADSADLDTDGLTDIEEEQIYKTDPSVPDTDGDKYTDGHEVFYLYNPDGTKPMKLLDSGLVKDYSSPNFNYQIYYPSDWAVGAVDPESRQVLFSTLTGENIEMRVFDLNGQSFGDWFAQNATGQKFSDLKAFEGVFKEKGLVRSDCLVYYFTDNNRLYLMVYHTTDSTTVNFRATMEMMARSFRLSGNTVAIPLQQTEIERLTNPPTTTPTTIVETSTSATTPTNPAPGL